MAKKQQHVGAAARLLWSVSPLVDIDRDGWPVKLHVQAIAALQSWRDGDGEETPELQQRLADWAYAIRGACTYSKTLRHERRVLRQNPMVMGGDVVGVVTDSAYYITALDFSEWLAVHGEAPSPLVQLWFKHQGVASPAPAPAPAQAAAEPAPVADSASSATETKEQRQDRRLQACIDAGLPMDTKAALSRLPDGVGGVADYEGVTRQSFSADVKAALQRRESAKREGAIVQRS